jgi:hypothetical protein
MRPILLFPEAASLDFRNNELKCRLGWPSHLRAINIGHTLFPGAIVNDSARTSHFHLSNFLSVQCEVNSLDRLHVVDKFSVTE